MKQNTYTTLREANRVRQREWDTGNQVTPAYRGNELAGEVGEACNIIKKLERERLGIQGSRATVDELGAELADVVICADLLAMDYGIDLDAAVAAKFNATSEKVGLATRLANPIRTDQLWHYRALRAEIVALGGVFDPEGGSLKWPVLDLLKAARAYVADATEAHCHDDGVELLSAIDAILDDTATPCGACGQAMKEGDAYYPDLVDGGVLHAECVGQERENFTDARGEPLAPDAPIPSPMIWSEAK